MIITDNNQREGWLLSTTPNKHKKLGVRVQDSPKQDYLFCPECESRFGVLERYVANHLYNRFREQNATQDFPITRGKEQEVDHLTALKVDPIMFKLFIYSFVWRASVSTHLVFNNFKLPLEVEEPLREVLDKFLKDTEPNTLSYIQKHASEFPHLPMNIVTTEVATNATSNFLQPLLDTVNGKVLLYANEFIVFLYPDWNAPRQGGQAYNLADSPLTISFVSQQDWNQLHHMFIDYLSGISDKVNMG